MVKPQDPKLLAPSSIPNPDWAPARRLGPLDFFLLVVLVAAAAFAWPQLMSGPGRVALVRVNGKPEAKLQLVGPQREWVVQGNMGPLKIAYGSDGVRVLAAACPNQICVRQGWVRRAGSRLICLPSHIVIAVDGSKGKDQATDGVTY
jgi:hypothetical protein